MTNAHSRPTATDSTLTTHNNAGPSTSGGSPALAAANLTTASAADAAAYFGFLVDMSNSASASSNAVIPRAYNVSNTFVRPYMYSGYVSPAMYDFAARMDFTASTTKRMLNAEVRTLFARRNARRAQEREVAAGHVEVDATTGTVKVTLPRIPERDFLPDPDSEMCTVCNLWRSIPYDWQYDAGFDIETICPRLRPIISWGSVDYNAAIVDCVSLSREWLVYQQHLSRLISRASVLARDARTAPVAAATQQAGLE